MCVLIVVSTGQSRASLTCNPCQDTSAEVVPLTVGAKTHFLLPTSFLVPQHPDGDG
jgi:hypothetical protein